MLDTWLSAEKENDGAKATTVRREIVKAIRNKFSTSIMLSQYLAPDTPEIMTQGRATDTHLTARAKRLPSTFSIV